jgi:hypothetical protein
VVQGGGAVGEQEEEDITLQEVLDLEQAQQEDGRGMEESERQPPGEEEDSTWMAWFAGGAAPCEHASRPKSD